MSPLADFALLLLGLLLGSAGLACLVACCSIAAGRQSRWSPAGSIRQDDLIKIRAWILQARKYHLPRRSEGFAEASDELIVALSQALAGIDIVPILVPKPKSKSTKRRHQNHDHQGN